jgi:hypothetical protein
MLNILVLMMAFLAWLSPIQPEPVETPQEAAPAPQVSELAHVLTREDFYAVAVTVGYQSEWVIDGLYRIACGPGYWTDGDGVVHLVETGESGCDPSQENVNEHGRFIGLLQIWSEWAYDCGVEPDHLLLPAVNLACARVVIAEGERIYGDPFHYWSVQP